MDLSKILGGQKAFFLEEMWVFPYPTAPLHIVAYTN